MKVTNRRSTRSTGTPPWVKMKRLKVVLRPTAIEDLTEIILYVYDRSHDRQTAARYAQRLRQRCLTIGEAPFGGGARDDSQPGLRTVPFERRLVIAYRVTGDTVEITNIFAGGRDYETLYRSHFSPLGD